jgi:hypothetical protein
MNSTFKRNLIIGFGFSLLLLVISSVASFMSIRNLVKSSEQVEHTNQVIRGLDKVIANLVNAETGQRGYLLTGDEAFSGATAQPEPAAGNCGAAIEHAAEAYRKETTRADNNTGRTAGRQKIYGPGQGAHCGYGRP